VHVPLERDTVQVDDANDLRGAPIKVAIVRSQRLVGDALAALVNQEPDMTVIGNLDYGDVSHLVMSGGRPDIVIFDFRMNVPVVTAAALHLRRSGWTAPTTCSKGTLRCCHASTVVCFVRSRSSAKIGSPETSARRTRMLVNGPMSALSSCIGRPVVAVPITISDWPVYRASTASKAASWPRSSAAERRTVLTGHGVTTTRHARTDTEPFRLFATPVERGRERDVLVVASSLEGVDTAVHRVVVLLLLAGPAALLRRLTQLDESAGAVLVTGHNPGLHELALALALSEGPAYRALAQGKFPTTARASLAVEGPWSALGKARHRLTDYVTVKSLDDKE